MNKEKFLWWPFMILFGIMTAAAAFGIAAMIAVTASNPVTAAFVIGLIGFWLFANRLIFGYGAIVNVASQFLKGEKIDKTYLIEKVKEPVEKLRGIGIASLLILWQKSLEPFKYSYYMGFFLILVITLIFGMNIIIMAPATLIVKSLAFGAAIPTLIVWGLELLATYYINEIMKKAVEEING